MIGILIIPILICGYISVISFPREKFRLSLYQGWSLYLRAATFGSFIVFATFVVLALVLPFIGRFIGLSGLHLLPDSDLIRLTSDVILGYFKSSIPTSLDKTDIKPFLNSLLVSLSIWSMFFTYAGFLIIRTLNNYFEKNPEYDGRFSKVKNFLSIDSNVTKIFSEKSPIEYHLISIVKQFAEDDTYNKSVARDRKKIVIIIAKIRRSEKFNSEIRKDLLMVIKKHKKDMPFRKMNYALITLESGKSYVCYPYLIPHPDEEGIPPNSISVLPMMSGFRDKDKKLEITTWYDFELDKNSMIDCISINRESIVTVSGFSLETFRKLNPKK